MQKITEQQKKIIDSDPYFRGCIFCGSHPEIDHVFIFARKQIAELWNYTPLCLYHHRIGPMCKMSNAMIREAVELHTLSNEQMKNAMCEQHGVPYKPVSAYNKTGEYSQKYKYLLERKSDINQYLIDNDLNPIW
jgi:hypothetical protein